MKIETEDVRKGYGDVTALDGVSIEIPSGETYGLLGTNGAGKSTLLKLLVGHGRPDSGSIRVGDVDVVEARRGVREFVGYLPDRVGFPGELTGKEVVEFNADVRGATAGDVEEALATVGLTGESRRRVNGYSTGMKKRLGLAVAILHSPEVLLLDEPISGLDPLGIQEFHSYLGEVVEDTTVVLASHRMETAAELCGRAAILHEGRVRDEATVDELRTDDDASQPLSLDDAFKNAVEAGGEL